MVSSDSEGWDTYRRQVVGDIQRLDQTIKDGFQSLHVDIAELHTEIDAMRNELTALKVKAGVWGFLAGTVPGVAAVIFAVLKKP